ncbi:unnamed protein product [Blepharisma stoltei]|uniref:Uncharacterized protein n=1 Tax=Blepharisma stoltei TaxID=1481888 RepID=A0AAU9J4W9_9CILI|nr:unnamed protein product [Blepharisma stoltei]
MYIQPVPTWLGEAQCLIGVPHFLFVWIMETKGNCKNILPWWKVKDCELDARSFDEIDSNYSVSDSEDSLFWDEEFWDRVEEILGDEGTVSEDSEVEEDEEKK